jgi:hypothetical protein
MSPTQADDALTHCARIRDLILHHEGGRADTDALRLFRQLSCDASRAADDEECAALLRIADGYAADLFSAFAHDKWSRGETSGAHILRLCILGKLDTFRDRLVHLQT